MSVKHIFGSRWKACLWYLPLCIALGSRYFFPLPFSVNDDAGIIAALNGFWSIDVDVNGLFMAPLQALFLKSMYASWPGIPWFSLQVYLCLVLSHGMLTAMVRSSRLALANRVVILLGIAILFLHIYTKPSFTAASLSLLCTAFLWLLAHPNKLERRHLCVLVAAFALGYLLRPQMLQVAAAAALPLLLLQLLFRQWKLAPLGKIVALLLIPVSVNLAHQFVTRDQTDIDGIRFQKTRGAMTDTRQGEWNERTPTSLSSVGWSKDDYVLAKTFWWAYDSHVFSEKKIAAFLANNASKADLFGLPRLRESLSFFSYHFTLCLLILLASFFFVLIRDTSLIRQSGKNLLFAALGLCLILVLAGIRFPARIAFPMLIFLLGMPLLFEVSKASESRFFRTIHTNLAVFCLVSLTAFSLMKIDSFWIESRAFHASKARSVKAFADFSKQFPAKRIFLPTYIFGPFDLVQPFHEFSKSSLPAMVPFGWMCTRKLFWDVMRQNGFAQGKLLIPQLIDNPKVAFFYWQGLQMNFFGQTLQNYLNKHYRPANPKTFLLVRVLRNHRQDDGLLFFDIQAKQLK